MWSGHDNTHWSVSSVYMGRSPRKVRSTAHPVCCPHLCLCRMKISSPSWSSQNVLVLIITQKQWQIKGYIISCWPSINTSAQSLDFRKTTATRLWSILTVFSNEHSLYRAHILYSYSTLKLDGGYRIDCYIYSFCWLSFGCVSCRHLFFGVIAIIAAVFGSQCYQYQRWYHYRCWLNHYCWQCRLNFYLV